MIPPPFRDFVQCLAGVANIRSCKYNLYYNAANGLCDYKVEGLYNHYWELMSYNKISAEDASVPWILFTEKNTRMKKNLGSSLRIQLVWISFFNSIIQKRIQPIRVKKSLAIFLIFTFSIEFCNECTFTKRVQLDFVYTWLSENNQNNSWFYNNKNIFNNKKA